MWGLGYRGNLSLQLTFAVSLKLVYNIKYIFKCFNLENDFKT